MDLDYDLKGLADSGKLTEKLQFIIMGGTALLLYNKKTRVTSDIDVIYIKPVDINKESIKSLLFDYNISNNVENVMEFPFKEDVIRRKYPLRGAGVEFNHINVFLATREDIILSKIFSSRPEDEKDLIEFDILDKADLDYIRERYLSHKDVLLE
ncbi:DUF6036 family nucleotidyltransferase [Pelagirhabdus alkalitolerans]|uniref:DUF6036 family nucleotidyltransferase n=1 Tax=Pelagirhabdus alkalitolerans TaxID=1612202 RepID=UPI0031845A24